MPKFADAIYKDSQRQMRRHRIGACPFPKSCYPVSCHVGANFAGVCSGIIHKSNNLDCIRLCMFYEDLDTHDVKYTEHFMTPTEAISTINVLGWAVKSALEFNAHYQGLDKELEEARKNGDKTPSQY